MEMFGAVRRFNRALLSTSCTTRTFAVFQSRRWITGLFGVCFLLLASANLCGQRTRNATSVAWFQARGQHSSNRLSNQQLGSPHADRAEHLPQWFRQHENLSAQAQERALRKEPGFNRLPEREQQRLFDRLQQLDAMPPERRERTLQRMEALEKLSPEQRQLVRTAMQQVTQMPDDRKRMMHKAFRDLSQLPQEQRQAVLNSPQFKTQFSDTERQTLNTLMSVQPYVPPLGNSSTEYGGK